MHAQTEDSIAPDLPERVFAARGWLAFVDSPVRRRLLHIGVVRRVPAGDPIAWAGQEGGGPFGLLQGRVGCWGSSDFSPPVLAYVAVPGDWFGHGPILLGVERSVTFRALEPSVLLHLPAAVLREMAAGEPALFRQFAKLSEVSSRLTVGLVADALMPTAERRLAAALVKAARGERDVGPFAQAPLPLGQAALAELASLSRSHVNRIFKRWTAEGVVEFGYNSVTLLSLDALQAIAGGRSG
jgi:CRP-like cAMP-binding protein